MATVPRQIGPQVQQAATPQVRVSTDAPIEAFGGGAGAQRASRAAGNLVQDTFDLALREKKKADDTAVQDAYTRTVKMKNSLMFDPEGGAITKQGKDAFGVVGTYNDDFSKNADEIEDSLGNEDQKSQYRLIREKEQMGFDMDLKKHVYSESRRYETDTFKATVETTRDDALLHYNDDSAVKNSVRLQQATIVDYADKNGLPPEWVKQAVTDASSKTYSEVINRMLANGQDSQAEKYYQENKDFISGSDRGSLEKNLEEGSIRGKSQRAMDNIVLKSRDMQSAMTEARKIDDPKLRDETERRIKDYYSTQRAAEAERQDNIFDAVANQIEQTKSRDSIPPAQWNAMSLQQRNAIDARIKQLREGNTSSTDRKVYLELTNMVQSDRQGFLKTNLMMYSPYLSDTDFKKFADMQADSKKGNNAKLDGFLTDNQVVDGVLLQMNINPKAKSGSDAEKAFRFRTMVDQRVTAYQTATGKKADNDVYRKITKELAFEGIVEKNWWPDQKKYAFELEGDEEFYDVVVPPSDEKEITAELRRRGKPVTETEVKKWYLRGLNE